MDELTEVRRSLAASIAHFDAQLQRRLDEIEPPRSPDDCERQRQERIFAYNCREWAVKPLLAILLKLIGAETDGPRIVLHPVTRAHYDRAMQLIDEQRRAAPK